MKDRAPSKTHFSSITQDLGTNLLYNMRASYSGVVSGEYDQLPPRVDSIISSGEKSGQPEARYTAGAIAIEAAVKLTIDPNEKLELITRAKDNWDYTVNASSWAESSNETSLRAMLGLATLPSLAFIAMNGGLPPSVIQETMYDKLLGIAHSSIEYTEKLSGNDVSTRNHKAVARTVGFTSELAVLLLHQRFTLASEGLGQLALPSFFSEDRGLSVSKGNNQSYAWDISIFQDEEDALSVPIKIQVKSHEGLLDLMKRQYQDEIITVCVSEDLGPPAEEMQTKRRYKPIRLLYDLLTEAGMPLPASNKAARRIPNAGSSIRIQKSTDRLLDILDENI